MSDAEPEITVRKMEAFVMVPLADDGTPLEHGERMTEIEPGRWVHPLIADVMAFLARATGR